MIFLELVLQNFGPYNGRQVIKLDPKLNDCTRPILLLGGMNGGGKTTLMDAIRLALYGHRAECSTRGNLSYADFLTQCVNSKASPHEQTRVELVFEHIENDKPVKYKIVRAWEKNPKEGKDSLGIFGDDDTWSIEALVNTWDDYIENILPLGISNLFLFDGEQVKELAEQEVPPSLVVDAIRALLGLELAERLAVDIEILVNRKRKEIAEKDDLANLEDIENELKQIQEEFEVNKLSYANLQEELKLFEQQYQEAENKFISEGGKIAAERSYLDKQKQEKTAEAEQIRQKMTQLASNVLPLVLIQPLLTQVQTQGEKEFHARQAQIVQDILLERDQRLLDLIGKLDIAKESLNKIKVFLEEDEYRRNSSALPEQPWLLADDEALSQLGNVIYYLHNAKISAKQLLASLKNKEEEILTIERQIQTAASPEAYDRLRDTMQKAQKQVTEAKANCETARRRLVELEAGIEKAKKNLKEYTEQTIDRKNREHIITASARVQETLKLFRERLTLRKLNKLENEVTECFRYLLHKSDLVHRIAIDTNTFSLSLYDLQGKPVPKHRLSAGEKQLLAIAFLWGLARISGRRLPVAIDTPLGRLDSSHRSNLVERYFPCASHQVILLSTDTEIGKKEVETLRKNEAIAREYLLKYDSSTRQTTVQPGYFW
ncbi:DNA sulfur modification protein DndD [Fischerella thermalis]|jgi:DNA sulfur modification protein DndD|uniref:Nuclease SbcCD subunit C n=3 Tax=Fischerella TaxID=1190 RepID=G6FQR6_9CYAN|nr:DNA sulfur modification protein DndD [Fischerella thermalis]EHC18151.1 DNA sulfur modification protein DndD [Fischerella thermalis JSC-11]PLZ08890.1 DNA sulfur modification protein DndD [Fischerella thermalis WC119]PLZ09417.1 DNA sulfur modification protein DndD [Fischerella thermalis WC114]PLZ18299.1 DNA sulfur modification protein DndD [Fischerella thermalis WC157]PLZ26989.1 DNA sulfur modification protein DndD [Fischerella thermalis WC341]